MWSSGAWRGAASQSAISLTFAAMAREHIHRAPCRSWPATKRWRGAMRARMPLGRNSPSFLMAPWHKCGAVEHGGVRLPRARFRSYSQRWRVDISTLRLALTVLVRCRGVALRARARPLVKIAPSISFCRVRVEAVGAACVKIGERLRGCDTQG